MAEKNGKHFGEKHASDSQPDSRVVSELKARASEKGVPCAVAFEIARTLGVPPGLVGKTADLLEMRLQKCQLGLFGYAPNKRIVKPADTVSAELEGLIQKELVDGRLSCINAWQIAENLGLGKMAVSSACERLNVKIDSCQLGAF